jgi:hypothetical protein
LVINAWVFLRTTFTGLVRTTSPLYTTVLVILNDANLSPSLRPLMLGTHSPMPSPPHGIKIAPLQDWTL